MQHKRKHSRLGIFTAVLLAVIAASVILLMTKDVKPTQQLVEKELDAKALFNNQQ
jgi:hypothetical protein